MTDRMDINRLLGEMRAIKSQTDAFSNPNSLRAGDTIGKPNPLDGLLTADSAKKTTQNFGDLFTQAIDKVNDVQKTSAGLAKAYEQGDPNVDITEVMVASQKASVSFQAMLQVRNKLVDSYRDVMNMPI
ncbi:MAG: flagellar hook-basal body complex protein FliE [Cellvibrionaceae bacterium]